MIYTEIQVTLYIQLYAYLFILHFVHSVSCCPHHKKPQQACASTSLPIAHKATFLSGRNMNYITMTQAQAQTRNQVLRKYSSTSHISKYTSSALNMNRVVWGNSRWHFHYYTHWLC